MTSTSTHLGAGAPEVPPNTPLGTGSFGLTDSATCRLCPLVARPGAKGSAEPFQRLLPPRARSSCTRTRTESGDGQLLRTVSAVRPLTTELPRCSCHGPSPHLTRALLTQGPPLRPAAGPRSGLQASAFILTPSPRPNKLSLPGAWQSLQRPALTWGQAPFASVHYASGTGLTSARRL